MSDSTIVGHDADMGITDYFEWDAAAQTFRVSSMQDAEPIIEANKARFNSTDERARWGDGQMVAEIPLTMLHEFNKMGIGDLPDKADGFKRLRKTLDDPMFARLRTRPGKLSRTSR